MTATKTRPARPEIAIMGRKADVAVGRTGTYDIRSILIDMTGWNNGEREDQDLYDRKIYPYRIEFADGKKRNQIVYGTNVNSACLQDLMDAAKTEFRAIVVPSTRVRIICPADCLVDRERARSDRARICDMKVIDLFTAGPDQKGLPVAPKGYARARLDTCLDDVAHQAMVDHQAHHPPLIRHYRFPYSLHDYRQEDYSLTLAWNEEHQEYKRGLEREDELRRSGCYYTEGGD